METTENKANGNKLKKIQIITATVVSILVAISAVTYGWFSWQSGLTSVVKVKNPSKIHILAGNTEAVENINIGNINLNDLNSGDRIVHTSDGEITGYSKQYVFSVCSENDDYGIAEGYKYYIQLGHTTNLDFTYKLYRVSGKAVEVTGEISDEQLGQVLTGELTEYLSEDKKTEYLYKKGEAVGLEVIDVDEEKTYGDFTDVQYQAVPEYSKTAAIEPYKFTEADSEYSEWYFTDYYILEVYWDYGVGDKTPPATKETDSVYLVVYDNQ